LKNLWLYLGCLGQCLFDAIQTLAHFELSIPMICRAIVDLLTLLIIIAQGWQLAMTLTNIPGQLVIIVGNLFIRILWVYNAYGDWRTDRLLRRLEEHEGQASGTEALSINFFARARSWYVTWIIVSTLAAACVVVYFVSSQSRRLPL
jgi:hypothetical protein